MRSDPVNACCAQEMHGLRIHATDCIRQLFVFALAGDGGSFCSTLDIHEKLLSDPRNLQIMF
jgi:hypothetical protein